MERCTAITNTGRTCARRAQWGRLYCGNHAASIGENPRRVTLEHNVRAEARPVPTAPTVTPQFVAGLIKAANIPPSYRRAFALEFCEAFAEHQPDRPFDSEAFLAAASSPTSR